MVTIESTGKGKCLWCRKDTEVVAASFKDGLRGKFCWSDFRKAVKVRNEEVQPKDKQV